jgi:16S rRNA (uracil1498-N3)-methyltransferase
VQLAVVEEQAATALSCQITLLQAIPKGKLFESIIQKATELGAFRIVPVLAERVASKLDDEDAVHKTEKWRHVAIEAIKQCGSPWLPQIEPPMTPGQFLSRRERFELPLVAALDGERRHPREFFANFQARHHRLPASICIWIGPEGDFTPAEMESIKTAGALPITLGSLVLRTETAATYCLSILNYELHSPAG